MTDEEEAEGAIRKVPIAIIQLASLAAALTKRALKIEITTNTVMREETCCIDPIPLHA